MTGIARTAVVIGVVASIALMLMACSARGAPQVVGGVTLLRFGSLNGYPAALMNGRVSFANGCASLVGDDGIVVTGFWSPGTHLDRSTGVLRIVVDGRSFAEGDEVKLGGGEYTDEAFVVSLVGPIPDSCRGQHYWLLNDLVTT